jgi:hypothetical protein
MRAVTNVNVVALEGFNERLGYAVGLGRSPGCEAGYEPGRLGERDGLVGAVTTSVVREPFDQMG